MADPETVGEYIDPAPDGTQAKLREFAPDAEESLKWGTPAFSLDRILFTYGGFKEHVGFYPTPAAIQEFEDELDAYETSESTIKFPLDEPLPTDLVREIAAFRVIDIEENNAKWIRPFYSVKQSSLCPVPAGLGLRAFRCQYVEDRGESDHV